MNLSKSLLIFMIFSVVSFQAFSATTQFNAKVLNVKCGDINDESDHAGHDYFYYGSVQFDIYGEKIDLSLLGGRLTDDKLNLRVAKSCKKLKRLVGKTLYSITYGDNPVQYLINVEEETPELIFDPYSGFNG